MARISWLPGSAVVFVFAAMAANANASPVGNAARKLAPAGGSNVEKVASRVCWRENGVRRCRSINSLTGTYGYQSPPLNYNYRSQIETDPADYPIGSTLWWRMMDYQDRGGQGNGHP
jgi:hypothetical protein